MNAILIMVDAIKHVLMKSDLIVVNATMDFYYTMTTTIALVSCNVNNKTPNDYHKSLLTLAHRYK